MKICLIGQNLTNLILANVFEEKKLNVDIYLNKKFQNKDVLELGSGDGSLSFWAARAGAKVICSDILKPKSSILNQIYKEKISFEIIDALEIPYENRYDFIIFKSLLGGIGRHENMQKQFMVMKQIKKS